MPSTIWKLQVHILSCPSRFPCPTASLLSLGAERKPACSGSTKFDLLGRQEPVGRLDKPDVHLIGYDMSSIVHIVGQNRKGVFVKAISVGQVSLHLPIEELHFG